ncbi:putative membrane protein SpoIIM required for sporulation [Blastomonas natatoria]|uniref:Putative membrane protein SpoIIM required for sporulation n=1 Tax=Blastomonas natatoria TaxID=34015 RepID=A0A2V3V0P4_9SPHN|nr:stage II sporulation protein M [Blastomonas natatoria]PXW75100.1 putative membrane protein SpoIIM required for sporulation [Blastomonas natatoria]
MTEAALPSSGEQAIAAAVLRSDRFRLEREGDWQRLDAMVTAMEKGRLKRLSDADVMALPVLYRNLLSSLSIARESSLDAGLIAYLESLTLRAYFIVYGTRTTFGAWCRSFFGGGLGRAVRSIWLDLLIALTAMIAGAVLGFCLVDADTQWYFRLVPAQFSDVRVPGASREALMGTLFGKSESEGLAVFAAYLFSNNAQVAILAFALGFAFGVPTLLMLVYNMVGLGALLWVFASRGLTVEFVGWLSIHGTTELLAILLAGGAGLHIGRALGFPGPRSHLAALGEAGRRAAQVMVGVIVMLICAGLLEGFARQLIQSTGTRYGIGYGILTFWLVYFFLFQPRRA